MSDQHLLKHHYGGWSPSRGDLRDEKADVAELKIFDEVDPTDYMTAIYDQLRLGSCTANTVAEAVDAARIVMGLEPIYPSRLGIYTLERKTEGSSLYDDTGAFGRDGLKAARRHGLLPESEWAYTDDINSPLFYDDPSEKIKAHKPHLSLEYPYKVVAQNKSAIQAVLSNKQTICQGFTVYESFEEDWEQQGVMPIPSRREKVLGGHETLYSGYLKAYPMGLLTRNHWGEDWGLPAPWQGYYITPWEVVLDQNISSDFRTIRLDVQH